MLTETEQMAAIQRVLDGDIEGFTVLVSAFQAGAMRMSFAITGDRAAAEDVAQESFVAAFRHLHTYDSSRATFPAWLHGIVRNASRNFLRRKGGSPLISVDAQESEAVCPILRPDAALGIQEQMGLLDQALASLPVEWRRAFTLTEVEGVPYAEAAVMEGVPVGTIRSRVHRSRKLLQQALASDSNPAHNP